MCSCCCDTYLLTYLLTYSMVQSPSWAANWSAASQYTTFNNSSANIASLWIAMDTFEVCLLSWEMWTFLSLDVSWQHSRNAHQIRAHIYFWQLEGTLTSSLFATNLTFLMPCVFGSRTACITEFSRSTCGLNRGPAYLVCVALLNNAKISP